MKKFLKLIPEDVLKETLGIVCVGFGVILIFIFFKQQGFIGSFVGTSLIYLFGYGYFLLVALLFLAGVVLIRQVELAQIRFLGLGFFLFSIMGLGGLLIKEQFGLFGKVLAYSEQMIGFAPSITFYSILLLSGIVILALTPVFSTGFKKILSRSRALVVKTESDREPKLEPIIREPAVAKTEKMSSKQIKKEEAQEEKETIAFKALLSRKWKLPPLQLLQSDSGAPDSGDLKQNAQIIKSTLEHFGIPVEMEEIIVGPTVTQYTLKPAQGVKLSRITTLNNDLALSLAAHPIRIEAPIPGKSLVGIEVPNRLGATIRLKGLLEDVKSSGYLNVPLGRSISGEAFFSDIAKMPHLLVAGSTGSGKSILIHSIVLSLLYQHSPETLRFILIDPKRVELMFYAGLPHTMIDPVLNPKKAVSVFRWVIQEMERRYDLLEVHKARDLADFNATKVKEKKPELVLPYIVLIIDELADLMQVSSREVEAAITRISQMARAVGIHLILATQRPSVDVLTGLIKANITHRIALRVASQIDSRTILDTAGAERLIGKGDLLYIAPHISKPKRLQGPLVTTDEIKKVVHFWESQGERSSEINIEEFDDNSSELNGDFAEESDLMLEEALEVIKQSNKASASLLQRKLKVGYARAARILDILESRGYIGPGEGAKPRAVFSEKFKENDAD